MSQYELGIATHVHYVRLSQADTMKVKEESARLGIPMTEVFRRALDAYFELCERNGVQLTSRQIESLKASIEEPFGGKYNLLGDKEN